MFRSEVRFYREIAPTVGVRVPDCYRAEISDDGTLLVLEDLSSWQPGADPVAAAQVLAAMHARWTGRALARWPWLRPVGAAVDLVEALYDETWPQLTARQDLTPAVADLARKLLGSVAASERATEGAGPLTLTHGDASMANMRTGPAAEIVLLDWEDVSASPGIVDLAAVLPAVAVQGLFSLSDTPDGSAAAAEWIARLDAVTRYLGA
jgi:aminoglycoside phosphotransferase (APT) family kinase protein